MSAERIFISEGVRKEEFIFCSTASLFAGALYLFGMNTPFAGNVLLWVIFLQKEIFFGRRVPEKGGNEQCMLEL